jgi:mono/diheme cytochrome c family protein
MDIKTGGVPLAAYIILAILVLVTIQRQNLNTASASSRYLADRGKNLYVAYCAGCHGENGDGAGKAAEYLYPQPRDFTRGLFKIRTTPSGSLPTDEDLLKVISQGMYGSGMSNFDFLTVEERKQIVQYIKSFSEAFQYRQPDPPVEITPEPPLTSETVQAGRRIYEKMECGKCHGDKGQGDGPSARGLKDEWNVPILVKDFTTGVYKGGPTDKDLYLRFTTGMNGTPMPAYVGGLMSDQERWQLVHYVQSLRAEEPKLSAPPKDGIVKTYKIQGEISGKPNDTSWEKVPAYEIPIFPLWQTNRAIAGLTVRSIHNGSQIGFLLEWQDPIFDTSFYRVQDFRDAVAIQFSLTEEPGALAMGDKNHPVNIWHWKADWQTELQQEVALQTVYPNLHRDFWWFQDSPEEQKLFLTGYSTGNLFSQPKKHTSVEDLNAKGFGTLSPQPATAQNVTGQGTWKNRTWQVVLIRELNSSEPGDITFSKIQRVPVSFSIWDGSQGDRNGKKYFSSWYWLGLE